MVIFGLFHGLVYLPVLLSWIGPSAYSSADRRYKGDDVDLDNNRSSSLQGHDNLAMKSAVSISCIVYILKYRAQIRVEVKNNNINTNLVET